MAAVFCFEADEIMLKHRSWWPYDKEQLWPATYLTKKFNHFIDYWYLHNAILIQAKDYLSLTDRVDTMIIIDWLAFDFKPN